MARKIIIIPTFASSHLLKCWIPNIIEAVNPDIIIINEGLFPEGPENKGHIDDKFREKWCYGSTNKGFDFNSTLELTRKYRTNGNICPNVVVLDCNYGELGITDANKAYLYAITKFEKYTCYKPQVGDIIFPLEPDAFLLETDKDIIQSEIERLKPGEGLKCLWRDFLETQYYCEAINEVSPKVRRFCYCFDNMENYKKAMDGFMSQSYPNLQYTDKFWVRHYPWFVHDKWKELRYELIWRKDPQYWEDFESGLQRIRKASETYHLVTYSGEYVQIYGATPIHKIKIRPSRQDEARWAQFIDVPHPEAIKSHPNFVK